MRFSGTCVCVCRYVNQRLRCMLLYYGRQPLPVQLFIVERHDLIFWPMVLPHLLLVTAVLKIIILILALQFLVLLQLMYECMRYLTNRSSI